MSLEAWSLVQELMDKNQITLSEALELLVRHGTIRYEAVTKEQLSLA